MPQLEKETFCHCFGCDNPIYVGDYAHCINYSYEKIESSMLVSPSYSEALGTWCSECFAEMLEKGKYLLTLEHVNKIS